MKKEEKHIHLIYSMPHFFFFLHFTPTAALLNRNDRTSRGKLFHGSLRNVSEGFQRVDNHYCKNKLVVFATLVVFAVISVGFIQC